MRRLFILFLYLSIGAGCVAHEAAGDQAAARGDWQAAMEHYNRASKSDPRVQEKHHEATRRAADDAKQRALRCFEQENFECTLREAAFALQVRPSDAEAISLRTRAQTESASLQLGRAKNAMAEKRFAAVEAMIEGALQLSPDPAIQSRGSALRSEWMIATAEHANWLLEQDSTQAVEEAQRLFGQLARRDARYEADVKRANAVLRTHYGER